MIKKFFDKYVRNMINCETALIYKKIDSEYNDLSEKINNQRLSLENKISGIMGDIEQKDQRITDLIEQTKNQIIERMVSTEIKPKGEIKELSKEQQLLMIFRNNPQRIISPKQIHEALGCTKKHEKGYISLLLQNLIKKGLIKKVKHGLYQYDKGW